MWQDPTVAVAVIVFAGGIATIIGNIVLELIRERKKGASGSPEPMPVGQQPKPPEMALQVAQAAGSTIVATERVDQALERIKDWQALARSWEDRYNSEHARALYLEDERNALRDQVRDLGAVPVEIPRSRAVPSVIPDEAALHRGSTDLL